MNCWNGFQRKRLVLEFSSFARGKVFLFARGRRTSCSKRMVVEQSARTAMKKQKAMKPQTPPLGVWALGAAPLSNAKLPELLRRSVLSSLSQLNTTE
jgi:hypothetical protein